MAIQRRFNFMPSTAEITAIEGLIIVDLPDSGPLNGVGTGVVGVIGECPDMTLACQVSSTGGVTEFIQPTEVLSAEDFLVKFGGFDSTLGEFGVSGGNLFHALSGKKFPRLIAAPLFLASDRAARFWRDLPTNIAAATPAPVVAMQSAAVDAGRIFNTDDASTAKRIVFTATTPLVAVADAVSVAGGAAPTQVITSATAAFVSAGVAVGDIAVFSRIGGTDDGQYRITAVTDTNLTVQAMDGTNITFTGDTNQALRVHNASDADTGVGALATTSGYTIPIRNMSGGTLAAALALTPAVAPPSADANSWDPLSGLKGVTHPSGVTSTSATQAVNAVSSTALDTLYETALNAFKRDEDPINAVTLITTARCSAAIGTDIDAHCDATSKFGRSRFGIISPPLGTQTVLAAISSTAPGAQSYASKRIMYAWPGERSELPQAIGTAIKIGDTTTTTDGILDRPSNMSLIMLAATLPPWHNPAQLAEPVPTLMAGVLGMQRFTTPLNITVDTLIMLKNFGICALTSTKNVGFHFQSGITTSLIAGETQFFVQHMQGYIGDSIAELLTPFQKLPATQARISQMHALCSGFGKALMDPNGANGQAVADFQVDMTSGNTPAATALGIFVVIIRVQLLPNTDYIVIQNKVSTNPLS